MHQCASSLARSSVAAIGLAAAVSACGRDSVTDPVLPSAYLQTKLVADAAGQGAATVDPNLVNAWGLAFSAGGTLWTSNRGTGTSSLYNAAGVRQTLVVAIPSNTAATGGKPTGIVFNPTPDFVIPGGARATFIFSGEDGVISGWNTGTGASARVVANRASTGAVYKGLALASNGVANFLYATDFKNNKVDVFDRNFQFVSSFTDPTVPAGFAPFGIQNIGGTLFVTFAKQGAPSNVDDVAGAGNGFVDIFTADGTMLKRFASGGRLNSPWAVVMAPAGFGSVAGNILIGNFGDGRIGAYDATTGTFRGFLRDASNAPLAIDGLWDLKFGVGAAPATTLYFSSGPNGETHGLVGTLTAMQ